MNASTLLAPLALFAAGFVPFGASLMAEYYGAPVEVTEVLLFTVYNILIVRMALRGPSVAFLLAKPWTLFAGMLIGIIITGPGLIFGDSGMVRPSIAFVVMVLLSALLEELWFRGAAFEFACRRYGVFVAAVVGSVFFAAMHAGSHGWMELVELVLAGYCLGLSVVVFRSFWSAVGFHFSHNLSAGLFPGADVAALAIVPLVCVATLLSIFVSRRTMPALSTEDA